MPDVQRELHDVYHPIIAGVRRLEKPVVAAVNGPAVGIGCSLALACDIVLAAESAFFGLAFVNIGLMPDGGSTLFVPAAVGKARAFQMALLGERVESARALEWGLVNEVHPDDELLPAAEALASEVRGGPHALLRRLQAGPEPDALPPARRAAGAGGRPPARPGPHRRTSWRASAPSWSGGSRPSRAYRALAPTLRHHRHEVVHGRGSRDMIPPPCRTARKLPAAG